MDEKVTYYKKVSKEEAEILDQDTKKISVFNMPTKVLSISYMVLSGRHPNGNKAVLERDCSFAMYVTKGQGKYIIQGDEVTVSEGDAVFVRAGSTFVAEGNFEYVTVVVPAFHPDTVAEITP